MTASNLGLDIAASMFTSITWKWALADLERLIGIQLPEDINHTANSPALAYCKK